MHEPTLHDVLDAITTLSVKTDARFEKIDSRFDEVFEAIHVFSDSVDRRFEDMDRRFGGIDQRLDGMDRRFVRVENQMVTKSYLDDKLADLTSDLVRRFREEDELVVMRLEKKFGK